MSGLHQVNKGRALKAKSGQLEIAWHVQQSKFIIYSQLTFRERGRPLLHEAGLEVLRSSSTMLAQLTCPFRRGASPALSW